MATFTKNNKWIILASIFFLVWKFFLIHTLWQDRIVTPEPDDSYIYIGQIESVKRCSTIFCEYPTISFQNYTGFTYLSYRLFFGLIAQITNFSSEIIFHLSFYFGTILLLPVLIYLTSAFTKNKNFIALMILFLTLYNGSGSYHGFFWVVPSFFATMLFLLIIGIVLNNSKHWLIYLTILLPIFIFIHPTSIYALIIFPLFYIFYILTTKKWHTALFKKIFFISIISLVIYTSLALYINKASNASTLVTNIINTKKELPHKKKLTQQQQQQQTTTSVNPYTPPKKNTKANTKDVFLPGTNLIQKNYLDWLFPHWLAYIPFITILIILIYFKKFKLLTIYFSLLIFTLLSSLHQYGYRSLVFIWPITYILYGMGFWYILIFIKKKITNKLLQILTKIIVFISLSLFILLNIAYSYIWNQYINTRNNISINKEYISYLEIAATPQDKITYTSKLLYAHALNSNLINIPMAIARSTESATYFILLDNAQQRKINPISNSFFNTLSSMLHKERIKKQPFNSSEIKIPKNFTLIKTFDSIKIYKKTNEIL